jgi:hypothetical protein
MNKNKNKNPLNKNSTVRILPYKPKVIIKKNCHIYKVTSRLYVSRPIARRLLIIKNKTSAKLLIGKSKAQPSSKSTKV